MNQITFKPAGENLIQTMEIKEIVLKMKEKEIIIRKYKIRQKNYNTTAIIIYVG